MGALDDALKGWTPRFGNQDDIRIAKHVGALRVMQVQKKQTKLSKERMKRLEESIIHSINQSKSV